MALNDHFKGNCNERSGGPGTNMYRNVPTTTSVFCSLLQHRRDENLRSYLRTLTEKALLVSEGPRTLACEDAPALFRLRSSRS